MTDERKKCCLCGKEIPPLKTKTYIATTDIDKFTCCKITVRKEICVFCEMRLHGIHL